MREREIRIEKRERERVKKRLKAKSPKGASENARSALDAKGCDTSACARASARHERINI